MLTYGAQVKGSRRVTRRLENGSRPLPAAAGKNSRPHPGPGDAISRSCPGRDYDLGDTPQMSETAPQPADAMVIFGITGDLARKMTFRSLYRLEAGGQLDCPVIGVAREQRTDDQLRSAARDALEAAGEPVQGKVFDRLARRLSYHQGDFTDSGTYQQLAERLKDSRRPLFYLEIPPSLFAPVVQELGRAGLTAGATVMIEKPFGHDLASARALNAALHEVLAEEQILRIDHFLGKQPVLDLHFLRFANTLLEPLWDKKADVFRAMPDVDPDRCVLGQYEAYRKIPGVKQDSRTETYVALRLGIDSWRWAGVPFYIRAGKALAARATEVRVIFKRTPRLAFLDEPVHPHPNQLVLRIDPDPGLRLGLLSKAADGTATRDVHLDLAFAAELGQPPEPYERLIHDALIGDHSLFTRQDVVEETWRVLQPLVERLNTVEPIPYPQGSWGPPEAEGLCHGHPPWHLPWLPQPTKGDNSDGNK